MKQIRLDMRFGLRDLAAVMKVPYRTLQNYEGGQRAIPQEFSEALRAEQIRHNRIRTEIYKQIEADIDRMYPNGIRSAPEDF